MQKNRRRSKKQLPDHDRAKNNSEIKNANIYNLIKSIPSSYTYYVPYSKQKDNLRFAKDLLAFIVEYYPEHIEKLSFNPMHDNLAAFNGRLVDAITHHGHKIVIEPNEPKKSTVVLFDVQEFDASFYVLQSKYLHQIKDEGVRVGYAHLLQKLTDASFDKFLEHKFSHVEDTPMDYTFQMEMDELEHLQQEIESHPDDDDVKERHEWQVDHVNSIESYLSFAAAEAENFKSYAIRDIDNFYRSRPTEPFDMGLKKILKKALKINFNTIRSFKQYETDDNGYLPWQCFFKAIHDLNQGWEDRYIEDLENDANNCGFSTPAGYVVVKNGKVINMTPPKTISKLISICRTICKVEDYLSKHYNE